MARKLPNPESRHGKVQVGWIKQGVQVPHHIREQIRGEAQIRGTTGVKILGTAAMCLYFGLTQRERDVLYLLVTEQLWNGVDTIDPNQICDQFKRKISRREVS